MADSPSPRGSVIPCRVFVGGIAYNTTELELKNFFQSMFGHVKDSKIITDRDGVSKGYGFITFDNQEAADRALEQKTLYFDEKKLNIGQAIRKPNSGQFSRPSSPESPVSPNPQSQMASSPPNAAGGYVAQSNMPAGPMAYSSPQPMAQTGNVNDPSQYYYAQQPNGVPVEQSLIQPMAVNQQNLYSPTPSQQAIPMTCVNGWYQPDARYIVQPQKPSQAHGSVQAFQWHAPAAAQAITPTPTAQWGRTAYMSTPAQAAVYTPTQAAASTYPTVYYQQPEPQWWDVNTGATMTQQYMPTDVFLDYPPQQHAMQQAQQHPPPAAPAQPPQVTYQKGPQPYHQHTAFVAQSPNAVGYSVQSYGDEHESHPYRSAQPGHRSQQGNHLLGRTTGRSSNGRRESSRRGRRSSSSFRGMRPSPPSSVGNTVAESAFSSVSSSFDSSAILAGDSSISSMASGMSPASDSALSKPAAVKTDS